ncbi:neprilysin-1-like [Amblyomma americanum]
MSSEQQKDTWKQRPTQMLVPLDEKSQSVEPPPVSFGSGSALSSQTEQKSREPPEQPLVEYGDIRRPSVSVNEGSSQPPANEPPRKSIGSVDGDPGPEKVEDISPMPIAGDNVDMAKEFLEGIWSSEESPKAPASAAPMSTALVPLDEREEEQHRPIQEVLPPEPLPLVPVEEKPPPAEVAKGQKESRSGTASGTASGSSTEGSESETSTSATSSTGSGSTSGSSSSSSSGSSTTGSGSTTGSTTASTTRTHKTGEIDKAKPAVEPAVEPKAAAAQAAAPAMPSEKPPGEASSSSSSESTSSSSSGSESGSSESGSESAETAPPKDDEKKPLLPKPPAGAADVKVESMKPGGDIKSSTISPSGVTSATSGPSSESRMSPLPPRHPPVPPGGLRPNRPPPKPPKPKEPPPPPPSKGSGKLGNDPSMYGMLNNEIHRDAESKNRRIPCCLLAANIVAVLILVIVSHALIVYELQWQSEMRPPTSPPEERGDDHVCRDVQCSAAGTHLFYVLNASVRPCDSIYNYVCRSWIHEGPQNYRKIVLGAERIFVDSMYTEMKTTMLGYQGEASESEAVRKATDLFKLCLEEPKNNPGNTHLIDRILSEYGLPSWPYPEDAPVSTFTRPYVSLGKFLRDSGVGAVVTVKMLPDPERSESRIFGIDCSTFVVPMGTLLSFAEHKSETLLGYKIYIADVIKKLRPERQDVEKMANAIMAFEVNMAHRCNEACRKKRFKRTNLRDLKAELNINSVDWVEFLETVSQDSQGSISESTTVLVRSVLYLKTVAMVFENPQKLRRVMNYIGWRAVHHFMRHAGVDFRNLTESFMSARLKEERFPYDRSCLRDVNQVMPFAVGRIFAGTVLSRDHFDHAVRTVSALIEGFQVVLKEFQWAPLDWQSKFSKMVYLVSYPTWIKNFTKLNSYYEGVPNEGSYFNRYVSASRNRYQRYLSPPEMMPYQHRRLAEFIFPSRIVDLERRVGPPRETSFYDVRDNTLIVPAGAMQPPYYDTRRPWGLTFGGLGTMVARDLVNEMFHTPEGILKDDKEKKIFKERIQCLLDHLKKGLGSSTNPDCTSIITDIFSLRVAYEAYQIFLDGRDDDTLQGVAQMTPEQLFFISAVRTLCTSIREQHFAQVVLLGKSVMEIDLIDPAVMGMREFEDAFHCKRSNVTESQNVFNKCFYPAQSS